MLLRYMDIFKDFHCTGSDCRDNCCKMGWDIEIDGETMAKYEAMDTPLGSRLRESIYEEEGCWYMSQPCPFLTPEGLCGVQRECGEDFISEICREHPRFYEWFGDYKEAGVGLCCEETARLLCSHPEPLGFGTMQIDEEPDDLEFDPRVLEAVIKVRQGLLLVMQDRHLSIDERLGALEGLGKSCQGALDGDKLKELGLIGRDLTDAQVREACAWGYAKAPDAGLWGQVRDTLLGLEYMGDTIPELLKKQGSEELFRAREGFLSAYGKDIFELEHIGAYFLFRYVIKAVRSYDLLGAVETAVFFVRGAELILTAEYLEQGRLPDPERRAFLFKELSKEAEYSPENMDKIAGLG